MKMMSKIKYICTKYREQIAYLFVGGTTTVVSIASYYLFTYPLGLGYMTSTILSWIVSVLYAYVTNKIIVFRSDVKGFIGIFKEGVSFITCRLLTLFIEMGTMYLLVSVIAVDKGISKILVQFIIFVLNYVFSKVLVFRKKSGF